jgi:hypothetical protein
MKHSDDSGTAGKASPEARRGTPPVASDLVRRPVSWLVGLRPTLPSQFPSGTLAFGYPHTVAGAAAIRREVTPPPAFPFNPHFEGPSDQIP